MPTGACGINCDVCRLNMLGVCSSCGPGNTEDARKKLAAQKRILDAPCPILACAAKNRVDYCQRDCERFPCDEFRAGPYPFSYGYLNMQEGRRSQPLQTKTPSGDVVKVPVEYWEELKQRDVKELCEVALVKDYSPMGLLLPFLREYLLIDIQNRCLHWQRCGQWERIHNPFLELLCLVYLLNVRPGPLADNMVSAQELKGAHFFQGPHQLKVSPLLVRFRNDFDGFKKAAENLGGKALQLADAAYELFAFPKVPLYYLFWEGDEEFEPRLSILFDLSIERHLAPDAIWGLVNLVSDMLLFGEERVIVRKGEEDVQ
jgi:hypothetical protein